MPEWERELERCKEYLKPSFDRFGYNNWDDVKRKVKEGRWFLLAYPTSALLIEFHKHPRNNVLFIVCAGGNLDEITSAQEQLEAIAKKQGCDTIEIRGRKGWEKIAKKFKGYETHYVVIKKDL